ncbi:hypothetical protein E2562_002557 [Oryza meyeriana var. granulata]|uniref:Uncharacterized protein n=1 Tax=Oryza meyeriana var. granulata TaxID=110450 RepID=A0A6G1F2S6_9ORYZ|nr:hypothetical protein E2562_002557 [Oryza meyeriana var. granulata]
MDTSAPTVSLIHRPRRPAPDRFLGLSARRSAAVPKRPRRLLHSLAARPPHMRSLLSSLAAAAARLYRRSTEEAPRPPPSVAWFEHRLWLCAPAAIHAAPCHWPCTPQKPLPSLAWRASSAVVVDTAACGHGLRLRVICQLMEIANEAGFYKIIQEITESTPPSSYMILHHLPIPIQEP